MKRNIKKISLALVVVLSVFFFSVDSSTSEDIDVKPSPKAAQYTEEPPILIERFPENETKEVRHKLDSLLQRINKRHDFHGAVLVAKNGSIVYENQVGIANFNKKTPVNKNSVFQLASVSKQFTAAAIMLLYERNKIKLSDTVNAYFPGFPYEGVTIKNLLNHTSGLPSYFWIAEHIWKDKRAPTNQEMMKLLESSNVLRYFKPGQKFDYSNTGYFVLASIVEKVSGTSFSSFLKNNIFEPLQMEHTFVYSFGNDNANKNHLDGYRLYRGWRHLKINNTVNDAIVGDKNVYTTVEDLFKWTLALDSGKLLSKESLELMYSEGETIYGRKVPYGFGFRINTDEEKTIYHHGKWNGFSTGLTKYLEDDMVVIVLEHTGYRDMKSLNQKIKKIATENFGV